MKRLNIALLAGGDSSEREISLQSAGQIAEALDADKYNVKLIDIKGRDWHYKDVEGNVFQVNKNDFSITIEGEKTTFEYALILIHGTPGEDGRLQGYLDIMGIPYSSCGMVSSVITFDKLACKRAVADCGVNLAKEYYIRKGDVVDPEYITKQLGLPVFVKPNASGSSFGVTKVKTIDGILPAVEAAFKESDSVLIEEFIDGREMGCGIMIADNKEYIFPITEIVSKKEFFDYEAKYTTGFSDEITPADIAPEMVAQLNKMTLAAYKACGCKGVVRIDFIIRKDGIPFMIEVNSIPGMSGGSIVPKQVKQIGMTLGELYDIIIKDTFK